LIQLTVRKIVWPCIIIASTALTYAGYLELLTPALRVGITLWFLLVCPGMAYVQLLGVTNPLVQWTLAVAASFSIVALTAVGMLYLDSWSSLLGMHIISGITLVGAAAQIVKVFRSEKPMSVVERST
jgi:hypothetical protein